MILFFVGILMSRVYSSSKQRNEVTSLLPQRGFYWSGWAYTSGGTVIVDYESGRCENESVKGSTEQIVHILEASPTLIQEFQSKLKQAKKLTCTSDQTCPGQDDLYIAEEDGISSYSVSSGWFSGGDIYETLGWNETLCWIRNTIKEQGKRKRKRKSKK